jgi:glucokinase
MERRARRLVDRGAKTDILSNARKRKRERLTSGVWAKALEDGDELAGRLIDRAVAALAAAAASICNLIEYDAVVLGGGLRTRFADAAPHWIADAMQPHLFVPERAPAVVPAELGELGGAIGAARLVRP